MNGCLDLIISKSKMMWSLFSTPLTNSLKLLQIKEKIVLKKTTIAIALSVAAISSVQAASPLVVYTAGPKGLAKKLIKDFEKTTGTKVQVYQATTGRILARLEAEKAKPVADVVVLASWPAAINLESQGLLHQFSPKNVEKLHPTWVSHNKLFGYSGSALGITYNTRLVKKAPDSLKAYTKPEWKNKVVMPNPSESGSALDFISGFVNHDANQAWSLFSQWKDNGLAVKGANRPALNQVVSGAKSVVLAGVDYMGYSEKKKGNPIEVVLPKEGTVIAPRPAMILESSQHKKAAEQFVTYLLSNNAQSIVAKAMLLPGRADVKADPARPDYDDIKKLNYDWQWMVKNQPEVLSKFSQMFK